MQSVIDPQPMPNKTDNPALWDITIAKYMEYSKRDGWFITGLPEELIDLMKERDAFGEKKYGVRLTKNNGRNAFADLIQELLDACVYATQIIEEEKDPCGKDFLDILLSDLFGILEDIYLKMEGKK